MESLPKILGLFDNSREIENAKTAYLLQIWHVLDGFTSSIY